MAKSVKDVSSEITRQAGLGDAMTLVVSLLLPLLQGWFKKCQGEDPGLQSPRDAVLLNYDEKTDTFDQDFIEAGRRRSRLAQKKAARQDTSLPRKVSEAELDRLTEAAYRKVLTESDEVVSGCCAQMEAAAAAQAVA